MMKRHIIRSVLLLLPIAFLDLACMESATQVATDGLAPQFAKGGKKGKPGPKPSDPGVPLVITLGMGAFTGDGGGGYAEPADGVLTHLSGVNGNLLFDLRGSGRFVNVTAVGFDGPAAQQTRTFTNNGPTPDGLRGLTAGSASAVLESEWTDGGFFYSLRYGKDCSGAVTGPAALVTSVNVNTWAISGASGLLCRRKQKGRKTLDEIGSGGSFAMTLVKQ